MDALNEVADEHRAKGEDVEPLFMDLADESSVLAVRDEIVERSGRLDVLVNNVVWLKVE